MLFPSGVFCYNNPMKNILLTIEYDGTDFSGWQRQPGRRTVQGELERALSVICRQEIVLQGASRTDAGVHAFGQRASFSGEFGIPTEKIPVAANHLLAGEGFCSVGDVRITKAEEVDLKFHPRFDAKGKKYIYRILNSQRPDIMQRNYRYQIERPLDLDAMRMAASYLPGEQDFRSFMAAGGHEPESTVRTVYSISWRQELIASQKDDADISFEIIGSGFLYNMVRIIAGTLTDVGLGKIGADQMKTIIKKRDRQYAGHTAPPQGLYLSQVYFNKEELYENQRDV